MPRRSATDVARSREETLQEALALASAIGLDGLTVGGLADRLAMSKSGLIGRFGSKQELQLATLEQAVEEFRRAVYEPAMDQPAGRRRLSAICDAWMAYLRRPGGCFLTTTSVAYDAQPGAVNQAARGILRRWLAVLAREASAAIEAEELPAGTDPEELAFTLNALAVGTNCDFQLHRDPRALERGRRAMDSVLGVSRERASCT